MKRPLPDVTLVAYDNTKDSSRALKALNRCRDFFHFADTIFVYKYEPAGLHGDIRGIVTDLEGYHPGQVFEVQEMAEAVETDFSLFVSWDAYIINPQAWGDEWLQLDYIGAPWPIDHDLVRDNPDCRVGNSAFCLRSRKFMDLSNEFAAEFQENDVSDVWACIKMRKRFESAGIKYATVQQAADFSWELPIPEFPNGRPDAFGFHGINHHPQFAL